MSQKYTDHYNTVFYFNEKRLLHREDGPAVECSDGEKVWYLNGNRHRIDGPAIERPNGDKVWYLNGYLHRTDGPAIEWSNGDKDWYLNGKELTEEEFKRQITRLYKILYG